MNNALLLALAGDAILASNASDAPSSTGVLIGTIPGSGPPPLSDARLSKRGQIHGSSDL